MNINYDSFPSPLPSASSQEDNTINSITITIPSPPPPSSIPLMPTPTPTINPLKHPLNPPPPAQYQSIRASSKPTTTARSPRSPHSSTQNQRQKERLRATQVIYSCVRSPKHCFATFETRSEWVAHEKSAVHEHDPRPVLCDADAWYCGVQLTDELSSATSASSTPTSLSSSSATSSAISSVPSSETLSSSPSPPPPPAIVHNDNSIHNQQQQHQPVQPQSPICTLKFPTPTHLANHLFSAHDIWLRHDDLEIDAHAMGARRGMFWCGFCAETFIVDVGVGVSVSIGAVQCGDGGDSGGSDGRGSGGNVKVEEKEESCEEAWESRRFDHIEGHFLGVAGLKLVRGGGSGEWEGIFVV